MQLRTYAAGRSILRCCSTIGSDETQGSLQYGYLCGGTVACWGLSIWLCPSRGTRISPVLAEAAGRPACRVCACLLGGVRAAGFLGRSVCNHDGCPSFLLLMVERCCQNRRHIAGAGCTNRLGVARVNAFLGGKIRYGTSGNTYLAPCCECLSAAQVLRRVGCRVHQYSVHVHCYHRRAPSFRACLSVPCRVV